MYSFIHFSLLPNVKRIFLAASWISVVFQFTKKNTFFQKHICICWQNIHVANYDWLEYNHILNVPEFCQRPQSDVGQVDQVQVGDDQARGRREVQLHIGAILNYHQGPVVT